MKSELLRDPASSLEGLVDQYNHVLLDLIDKHAPEQTKVVSQRSRNIPWISDNIKAEQAIRRRYERKWRSTKLTVHRQMLTNQRDHVSDMCRAAKIEYYQTKIETCGSDQKKLYQVMNELLHRKGPALLPAHDSSKDLADKFCTFFTEKITSMMCTRSQLDSITLADRHTILSPITSSLGEGLSKFTLMTDVEILKIIKNSPTKSCSLDPLPTWLLKKTDTLLPTITQIINKSLASGTFPTSFKSALVRPLLKKTNLDTEVLRNYRPVSNLQYTSKVPEKVVAAQLTSYEEARPIREKTICLPLLS